jgi:hypothetical protein
MDEKQETLDALIRAVSSLFSAGVSELPRARAISIAGGLQSGELKLRILIEIAPLSVQCSAVSNLGDEAKLFSIEDPRRKRFHWGLASDNASVN